MNEEVNSYHFKTELSQILGRVGAGERFTIVKHGRPIADLIPSRAGSDTQVQKAIANILKARKTQYSDEELQQLKTSGRK